MTTLTDRPQQPAGDQPAERPVRPGDTVQTAAELTAQWDTDPRWAGVRREIGRAHV